MESTSHIREEFLIPSDKLTYGPQLYFGAWTRVYAGTFNETEVVIKVLSDRTRQAALEKELATLTGLRHERIVQPIGFCSEDGALVQEFVKGPTLASWLGRDKDTSVEWSVLHRIAIDVCFGLCYLHENRRVHGDVCTTNVLLSEGVRQNTWRAKLTAVSFADATSNHPIGSRAFDIFGFGIVLGELVNRKLPLEELRARAQDAALPKIVDECLNLPSPTVIEVVLLQLISRECKAFPELTEPSDSEPVDLVG